MILLLCELHSFLMASILTLELLYRVEVGGLVALKAAKSCRIKNHRVY